MRSNLFLAGAAIASGLWAMPALAEDLVFTLDNESSATVKELYVSALQSNSWEEDILHKHVLLPGETADVTIQGANDTCRWDVRIVYDDGSMTDERDIDLCDLDDDTYTVTD